MSLGAKINWSYLIESGSWNVLRFRVPWTLDAFGDALLMNSPPATDSGC